MTSRPLADPVTALAPPARAARRRNRRWLVLLAGIPVVFLIVAVVAGVTSNSTPTVKPRSVPAGYQAIAGPYFSFAVPTGWSESAADSDQAGDTVYQGGSSFAGETLRLRSTPPTPGEAPPASVAAFGQADPSPLTHDAGTVVAVPGADAARRYLLTRPDGFRAEAYDVWLRPSGIELWLVVHAAPPVTAAVLASLAGSDPAPAG